MKKILVSLSTIMCLTAGLSADGYLEGTYENISPEDSYTLGIQPTNELIGNRLNVFKVSKGWNLNIV